MNKHLVIWKNETGAKIVGVYDSRPLAVNAARQILAEYIHDLSWRRGHVYITNVEEITL